MSPLRAIAIHLPQFHPIPDNDAWWGTGFTEWTNVAKARPLFAGHYQPHLPADLGFYDLRLREARVAQARLAEAYGIHGFCYYHYWFNGKRLLERPVEDILRTREPSFPFMLCWANENWSRRWDGSEDVVLARQDYLPGDAEAHAETLLPYFEDDRYIRVSGKPVFCIYRPDLIPDIAAYIESFRRRASRNGLQLYLCAFESFKRIDTALLNECFDAAVEFQPHSEYLLRHMDIEFRRNPARMRLRALAKVLRMLGREQAAARLTHRARLYLDYGPYVDHVLREHRYPTDYKRFPGVTPMWDNTARRKENAFMLRGATPQKYGQWLKHHAETFEPFGTDENFLFINAWNEWAEGNHLEPCQRWGRQFLEATRGALAPRSAADGDR